MCQFCGMFYFILLSHMETIFDIDAWLSCLPMLAVLFAFGVWYVCRGYNTILFFLELSRRGQSAVGRVIGFKEYSTGRVAATHPLLSYQVNGKWYEVEGEEFLLEHFPIGREVVVRFLPENPKKCTWRKTCLTGIGALLLGLLFMSLSVWPLITIL